MSREDRRVISRIHHAGIVVRRLDDAYRFYRDVLSLPLVREAEVRDQGVRAALLSAGDTEIELLEPIAPGTGVARFLDRRGEGLHHVCFETPDVSGMLADLASQGVELIDRTPRRGLAGTIAFLHPRACDGVLCELATPPAGHADAPASPLRFKRLVVGSTDVARTSARFQQLFGLGTIQNNGGPRCMLAAGGSAILIVPAGEVGGTEGMVAVSFVSDAFEDLNRALDRGAVHALRGTGEVTIEPVSSHGVHLHISRGE
jgi:methylmalonyl-CoA/ethylmalonyl-CoA epimerase